MCDSLVALCRMEGQGGNQKDWVPSKGLGICLPVCVKNNSSPVKWPSELVSQTVLCVNGWVTIVVARRHDDV